MITYHTIQLPTNTQTAPCLADLADCGETAIVGTPQEATIATVAVDATDLQRKDPLDRVFSS